jgi:hypothetical protein
MSLPFSRAVVKAVTRNEWPVTFGSRPSRPLKEDRAGSEADNARSPARRETPTFNWSWESRPSAWRTGQALDGRAAGRLSRFVTCVPY